MRQQLFKSTITRRLFVQITGMILAFAILILIANTLLLKPLYHYRVEKNMEDTMDKLEKINFFKSPDEWLEEVYNIDSSKAHDIIITVGNTVIYSSVSQAGAGYGDDGYSLNSLFLLQWVDSWEEQEDGLFTGTIMEPQTNTELKAYAKRISGICTVYLTQPIEPMEQSIQQANQLFLCVTGVFLLLMMVIIFKLSSSFTKPIKKIQSSVRNIVKLDFSEPCYVKTGDELENLSNDINHLSKELEKSLATLTEQNKQLENDVILQRQFLSNASHELRTPLALIKGYADEINSGFVLNNEQQAFYVNIIAEEADKMNRLIKEMLELSRVQSGRITLNQEKQSVNQNIIQFLEKYDGFIRENELKIKTNFCEQDIGFFDSMPFEQILANYISNAARYGDHHKFVRISTQNMGEAIRVVVFNTGRHIKPENQENIWIGFNKVDEARTRVEGSYGLGLSIVKAIQTLTKQGYGVRNVENGVEFWFDVAVFYENVVK